MKNISFYIGVIVVLIVLFVLWFDLRPSRDFESLFKRSEDSIALYKMQNSSLLQKITKSEDHERVLQKTLNKLLDSLTRTTYKDSILHAKLRNVKEKVYTPHQLNEIWAKRYPPQETLDSTTFVSAIPMIRWDMDMATDSTLQVYLRIGRRIQLDLERYDFTKIILQVDSARINYLQGIVNVQDSISNEQIKQIVDYKKIVSKDLKIDSTRVVQIQKLKQEVKKQKRGKVIAIVGGAALLVLSLFAGQ